MTMREVNLPSGAVLKVSPAPFAESKALYQAILKEAKSVGNVENLSNAIKDLLCVGFSSPEIERCMWQCMKRCTLNELKLEPDLFEPVARRGDYIECCVEVVKENVSPFLSGLFAQSKVLLAMTAPIPK